MRSAPVRQLLILILAAGMMSFGSILAACEIKVGWEPWPPYQFEGEEGQITGLDGDLINAILDEMGCKPEWVAATWKRQLEGVESGEFGAVMSASFTDERATWGRFSERYRQSSNHLVVGEGHAAEHASLAAFLDRGGKLSVMKDYHYGDDVMALIGQEVYKGQIQETVAQEANMKKLSSGRVDGVLMDFYVAASLKNELGVADKIDARSLEVSTDDLHVLFSKASIDQATVDKFNTVLTRLQASGAIQQILDKYSK